MSSTIKLLGASVKMLFRDKQALFWALAFPVIFAVIFGMFDFEQPPEVRIGVVAESSTPLSGAVVDGLERVETLTVSERSDLDSARAALEGGDLDIVLRVPEIPLAGGAPAPGGGAPPPPVELEAYYDAANRDVNQLALGTVERIADATNLRIAGASPVVRVQQTPVSAKSVTYFDFLLPGLVGMGVMNFSIIGMAVAITRFREQRILRRILATPLAPVRFLGAQVGARLLLSVVQTAVILGVGVLLLGGTVYGNPLWIFVLAVVANVVFLNIGFAVGGRASNPDAAQGMGNAVALPMMFLSGVFFPTEGLPEVMQDVVAFLPLTPLLEALRTVSVDGESITATGPQLALLGVWAVVSFALASRLFRFDRA
ncbi:MAG TPA: ABC transporter permease [Actinomycetota bacterium]|nr:ABC transporter permease [Actinomycetota bacterium]